MALVESLVQNSSVRFLNLAENTLSAKSALALAGLIGDPDAGENGVRERRRAAPLESLELKMNCLVGGGVSLGRALQTSASGKCPLRYLGLNSNGLNENDALALASGLGPDGSLNVLNVGSNSLGRNGINVLIEAAAQTLFAMLQLSSDQPDQNASVGEGNDALPREQLSFVDDRTPQRRILDSVDISLNGVEEEFPHDWLHYILNQLNEGGPTWRRWASENAVPGEPWSRYAAPSGQLQIRTEDDGHVAPVNSLGLVLLRHLVPHRTTNGLPGVLDYPEWPYVNGPIHAGKFQIWTE